jgi:predicted Ser/Thr protein kinase
MSITVEVPPEVEEQMRSIPDLDERLIAFFHNEAAYQKWRNARYSERARQLLKEGMEDAERLKAAGISKQEIERRFQAVIDRIAP